MAYQQVDDVLTEEEIQACRVNESTWKCPSCQKTLSRKQTLKTHLSVKHQIRGGVLPKRYKQYETDESVPVPISTRYMWQLKENHQNTTKGNNSVPTYQHVASNVAETDHSDLSEEETSSIPGCSHNYINNEAADPGYEEYSERIDDNLLHAPVDIDMESSSNISTIYSDNSSDLEEQTSDETDEDGEEIVQSIASPPLYITPPSETVTNAPLTYLEHLLTVSGYATAFNLSGVAFQKLLDLIRLHVPEKNLCALNPNELKKKLGFGDAQDLTYFECCSKCGLNFNDTDLCQTPNCNTRRYTGNDEIKKTCFVTCDLKKQLCDILERPGISQKIHIQLEKPADHQDISDITTGSEYFKLRSEGNFLDPKFSNNITMSWNTDGIPLFKSSSVSLWPVYLTINELPPKERLLKKNIIIWGVWQGVSKPKSMNGFLSPFVKDIASLYHEGVEVKGEVWRSLLVTGTMDLQARAYVLNMTQHNGKSGCLYCLEEGISVVSGKGHCRSYPFRNEPPKLRSSQDIRQAVEDAVATGKPCHGLFGKCVLSCLPMYSAEKHVVIDYMHGVLLGIVKKLLSLWFDGNNYREDFFIGHKLDEVDKLLKKIKPPYVISRLPRKLKNNFQKWKASELRSWLLHYSLPCLSGILPAVFLEHFSCLVEGIYILLQEVISVPETKRAEQLLNTFYEHAAVIYGDHFLGLNVHNLRHYTSCVKMWGPLWAYSCFGYESLNGDILKSVHGKGNVCAQIFWAMQSQKMLEKQANILPKGELRAFLHKVTAGGAKRMPETIHGYMCDLVPPVQDLDNIENCILQQLNALDQTVNVKNLGKVKKIVRSDRIFYCQQTSRVKKRNSFMVRLDQQVDNCSSILSVDYYIVDKETFKVFAVGSLFTEVGTVITGRATHIQKVRKQRDNVVVLAHWIKELLVFMNLKEDSKYVSKFPNLIEKD